MTSDRYFNLLKDLLNALKRHEIIQDFNLERIKSMTPLERARLKTSTYISIRFLFEELETERIKTKIED
jgi:hypothetical protein